MTARKQTRRSVSVRAEAFDRLRAYCEAQGISMSSWLEGEVAKVAAPAAAPRRAPGRGGG